MINNLMTSEEFDSSIKTNQDLNSNKNNSHNKFDKLKNNQNTNNRYDGNSTNLDNNIEENFEPIFENEDDIEQYGIKQGKTRANNLKVMFLGGVGEIGKNMTVLEYGDDIMVIDAGLSSCHAPTPPTW